MAEKGEKFSVIYADPPWAFEVYSGKGKQRSAERYYDTSSLEAIKALPVSQLAADGCALFLWGVCPELPGALAVIEAWGFEYKTFGFLWVKQNQAARACSPAWATGPGPTRNFACLPPAARPGGLRWTFIKSSPGARWRAFVEARGSPRADRAPAGRTVS